MSRLQLGQLLCIVFVTLEAFQAVYLGAVFQNVDSFLVGSWVFGISAVACTVATVFFRPNDLMIAINGWKIILALNILAALTWTTYSVAIQLIEPAIVFTIFSGAVPLGTLVGAWFGMAEAKGPDNQLTAVSTLLVLVSILVLVTITVSGLSGFVRGGAGVALAGVTLSAISGGCTAFVILYSARLNQRGVSPLALFGLRFYLYILIALMASSFGLDDKATQTAPLELAMIILIGLGVIAFPLYLVQKAVPLVPASTIATITALGPVIVFMMQIFDGRIDYSNATLAGLSLYIFASLLMAYASTTHALPTIAEKN